jgi:hypothetical protein
VKDKLPIVRGFTHTVSPYSAGSVLENRLGMQVFRTLGKRVMYALRGSRSHVAGSLADDGVIVLPEFLPHDVWAQISAEFDAAELTFVPYGGAERGRIHVATYTLAETGEDFPVMREHLQHNPSILEMARDITRRRDHRPPSLTLQVYRLADPQAADNDIENVLHADLHTPTAKAFYYVDDVDEGNGAFIFAPGSHRITIARLLHEYGISIRRARLRAGRVDVPDVEVRAGGRRQAVLTMDDRRRMKINERQIVGSANTLVMANNVGFHRRGEFTTDRARRVVLVNFRHWERPFL